jgi:hypothetical protein
VVQGGTGGPAGRRPDPRSVESRREYLAWADPACDPGSAASRREYLAWLDPGAHLGLREADRGADHGARRANAVRANACRASAYSASTYGDKSTTPRTSPLASTARAANISSPDRGGGRAPPSRPATPRRRSGASPPTDPAPDATAHHGADPPAPGAARDVVRQLARRLAHGVAYQAVTSTLDPAGGRTPRFHPGERGSSVSRRNGLAVRPPPQRDACV